MGIGWSTTAAVSEGRPKGGWEEGTHIEQAGMERDAQARGIGPRTKPGSKRKRGEGCGHGDDVGRIGGLSTAGAERRRRGWGAKDLSDDGHQGSFRSRQIHLTSGGMDADLISSDGGDVRSPGVGIRNRGAEQRKNGALAWARGFRGTQCETCLRWASEMLILVPSYSWPTIRPDHSFFRIRRTTRAKVTPNVGQLWPTNSTQPLIKLRQPGIVGQR